jgi:elongation factor 1-beta
VNSTVTFEVKVYDNETDLDDLAKRILDMKIEGVQWNAEFKKLESEFGLMKLQMSCVIKSEKISMDDIF